MPIATTCPNCKALYHIVKVEAGPETVFQEVPCRVCGEPLVGREGNFVLKYFLLREAARVQKWRRRTETGGLAISTRTRYPSVGCIGGLRLPLCQVAARDCRPGSRRLALLRLSG